MEITVNIILYNFMSIFKAKIDVNLLIYVVSFFSFFMYATGGWLFDDIAMGYTLEEGDKSFYVLVKYDDNKPHTPTAENLKKHLKTCKQYDSKFLPKSAVKDVNMTKVSKSDMNILLEHCATNTSKFNMRLLDDIVESQKSNGIAPGTKWCGAGDIALSKDDLGVFASLDSCCREHDLCTDIIKPNETKHNLTNHGKITLLSCGCDEKFRLCMIGVKRNSSVGIIERVLTKTIGLVYFDCFAASCFKEEFPKKCCRRRKEFFSSKCSDWKFDKSKSKYHQYFDTRGFPGELFEFGLVNAACEAVSMILPDQNLQPAKYEKFPNCGFFDEDDDEPELTDLRGLDDEPNLYEANNHNGRNSNTRSNNYIRSDI